MLAERLAVFPAGATVESAVAVCADDRLPAADVSDLLLALVDKSLLTIIDGSPVRYRMLETIREYGAEQLAERGEAQAARTAHARYFADVAAACDPVLRTADQLEATRDAQHRTGQHPGRAAVSGRVRPIRRTGRPPSISRCRWPGTGR